MQVAVYGTLRQGGSNHRLLNKAPIKTAQVLGYEMVSLGGFPAIFNGSGMITVEVYEVNDEELRNLDSLEGYNRSAPSENDFYTCEYVIIDDVKVAIYTMNHQSDKIAGYPHILDGDWIQYRSESLQTPTIQ